MNKLEIFNTFDVYKFMILIHFCFVEREKNERKGKTQIVRQIDRLIEMQIEKEIERPRDREIDKYRDRDRQRWSDEIYIQRDR